MKVYSNMQANPMLKGAIEFAFLPFYIMHRIPFMLQVTTLGQPLKITVSGFNFYSFSLKQLFGSVAQMLDASVENKNTAETQKVSGNLEVCRLK